METSTKDKRHATVTYMDAYHERRADPGSPAWQLAHQQRIEREEEEARACQRYKDEQEYLKRLKLGLLNPPDPRRWLPLTTEDLSDEAPPKQTQTGSPGMRRLMDADEEGA